MALSNKLILALLLCCTRIATDEGKSYFVVWNVGQGQWSTWITEKTCTHFDMGGESDPTNKVSMLCRGKQQQIFISHLDWDHISFIGGYLFRNQLCKANYTFSKTSQFKQKILDKLHFCAEASSQYVHQIFAGTLGKNANASSQVYSVANRFLTPGDSTAKEENIWSMKLQKEPIETLILGHHGSKTSTSEVLLDQLPRLKFAISSARYLKYRHPHKSVEQRLKRRHVPLLRTEDWGHIFIEMKNTTL